MSETEVSDNKNKGVTEYMEKTNIDDEIIHWEEKLKHIKWEYSHSWTIDWPKIRERELFFIREIDRLKRLKSEKKPAISCSRIINNTIAAEVMKDNINSNNNVTIENNDKNKNIAQSHKDEVVNEEEQWDINNKLLLESYEENLEELEDKNYDGSEQNNDFYNSLDDVGLHNLNNAMEAMEVESSGKRRRGYGESSVRRDEERERPTRSAGQLPLEKDDYQLTYIPGQYRYMGTKRRDFERPVQFQNYKNDGAILNLAAHDPIDWPNIISIWKGLIV
jgi:hypothetical protein